MVPTRSEAAAITARRRLARAAVRAALCCSVMSVTAAATPHDPPLGRLQPVEGDRPHPLLAVRAGHAPYAPGEDGLARLQHLPESRLQRFRVRRRHGLPDRAPQVVGGGQAVDPLQRRVDQDEAEIVVEHGQAERRVADQERGQGQVPLHPPDRGPVRGEAQGVGPPPLVLEPRVAELHQDRAAVLVPYGEDPGSRPVARHHAADQRVHLLPVPLLHQQCHGLPPEDLGRGVAEEHLRLRAPQDDPALVVEDDGGHPEHVEEPARLQGEIAGRRVRAGGEGRRAHPDRVPPPPHSPSIIPPRKRTASREGRAAHEGRENGDDGNRK
ncbi:hypothetical protein GCM10019017_04770 [Streptomyces showdoensis]